MQKRPASLLLQFDGWRGWAAACLPILGTVELVDVQSGYRQVWSMMPERPEGATL